MSNAIVLRGQTSMEWNIKEFRSRTPSVLISEDFPLSDAKWHIQLYITHAMMSLYLEKCASRSEKHRVAFAVGIKRSDGSMHNLKYGAWWFSAKISCKRLVDIKTEDVLKTMLSPDGSLTIICTIRLVDDDLLTETATQTRPMASELWVNNFKDLLLSERGADITIKVKGREFQAHQLILSTQSTVFASMFQHDMAEKRSGIVEIEDCEPDSFAEFLLYIYTGVVDSVTSGNAPNLYRLADKYDMKELKSHCVQCMHHDLSIGCVCDVIVLATTHEESELLNFATDFFIKNAKAVCLSEKWPLFQTEHIHLANELLIKVADRVKC